MADHPKKTWLAPPGVILPPPPPGVRHVHVMFLGTVISDHELRARVDRVFHWPMIVLALAVLPLLAIEIFRKVEGTLAVLVQVGFAIIWLAFVIEFVVKSSIAESRVEYAKRNWLDLIIILVPILRPLRLTGSLVRTTRVFKVRGVAMKFARYGLTVLLGFEATDRFLRRLGLRRRKERVHPDAMTRFELSKEVRDLRDRTDAWENWYEAHRDFLDRQALGPMIPPPSPEAAAPDTAASPPAASREEPDAAGSS